MQIWFCGREEYQDTLLWKVEATRDRLYAARMIWMSKAWWLTYKLEPTQIHVE